jgi:tRNA wybutosine-synthesizing protein 2
VDLYAGIGYFAFSYAKAGVSKVLCWELNGWSVEGLRRGSEENGWRVEVVKEGQEAREYSLEEVVKDPETKLVVFHMSNEHASPIIQRVRSSIPPIRHVNCGLLPSSRLSWLTAVRALDPEMGGWIHIHENLAIKEIEERGVEIVGEIQGLLDQWANGEMRKAVMEHVERVKTYAPGVMHCVLDVRVEPCVVKG